MELYTTFIELFPSDIINIILPYSDNAIIIHLQNYFPKLLKHITIYKQEIFEIHKNNLGQSMEIMIHVYVSLNLYFRVNPSDATACRWRRCHFRIIRHILP